MFKSFRNISTNSEAKRASEALIHNTLQPLLKGKKLGKAVVLVGGVSGYERHKRNTKAFGFKESDIIYVERNQNTYEGLVNKSRRDGDRITVIKGDLFEVLNRLHERGHKISYVEADGVSMFGEFDKRCVEFAKKHKHLICMTVNGSSRFKANEYFGNECKKLKFRKTPHTTNWAYVKAGKTRYDQARIVPQMMQKWLGNKWNVERMGYKGKSPMYMLMITPKGV